MHLYVCMYVCTETAMDSGGDLMNANPNSASQANSSELSKILANIQQREVKISQFLEEKSVSRPPPSLAIVNVIHTVHTYIHTFPI